jgi:prolyl oligopeptidase
MRYPHSERGPVAEILHGVKVADPYRWLEDPDSAQTKEWVAAQNAVTEDYLAGLGSRSWFHERLSAILGVLRAGVPRAGGGHYRLGHDDDEVIYQPNDPRLLAWPCVFASGWLILFISAGTDRRRVVQARRLHGGTAGPVVHVVTEPVARFDPVGMKDDVLYLHTDLDAPHGKVVGADLARIESSDAGIWQELIPERRDILDRAKRAGHGFLAVYLRDAQHRVVQFDAAGAELGELDLREPGSVSEVNVEEGSEECFLGVESFIRGTRAYRVDLSAGRADPLVLADQTAPVPDVVTERRPAISADGTAVPYFLLRPAGAAAALPTLLYGYGGYNRAITPTFKAA